MTELFSRRFLEQTVEGCMSNSWRRGMQIPGEADEERKNRLFEANRKECDLIMENMDRHIEAECARRVREFLDELVKTANEETRHGLSDPFYVTDEEWQEMQA